MSFDATVPENAGEVQIWSGFGFHDRDNRYALGLRGGNNNDLYLCRYQSVGKDKMLALERVDFNVTPGTRYSFRIVFMRGNIRVYLNGEKRPRIAVSDDTPMQHGFAVLGGGWVPAVFNAFSSKPLTGEEVGSIQRIRWSRPRLQLRGKRKSDGRPNGAHIRHGGWGRSVKCGRRSP